MIKYVRNAIRTPDGTVITSRHRHDFQQYTDKNTKTYAVDGGLEYIKVMYEGIPDYEDLSVPIEGTPFEIQREVFSWGTYGADGKQEKRYVLLKDLQDQHLQAILQTQTHIRGTGIDSMIQMEIDYRAWHGITIE